MKISIQTLMVLGMTGTLLASPVSVQGQAGSGTSRSYGWNQSVHPVGAVAAPFSPMAPPIQNIPTAYGVDPYRPVTTTPVTQSHLDPGSGSLWSEGSLFNSPFDFEPVNSFSVGDHIVVMVADNFRSKEDTRYKNETDSQIDFNIARFLWHSFAENPYLNLDIEGEEEYEGKSRGNITSNLTLEIPTEVKKILPDGRLLIEGRTSRIIGRDIKQVLITGIVQPRDIDYSTRSIDGSRVLDMQVKWEGNGPGPNVLKPGFFHRFLDYVPLF